MIGMTKRAWDKMKELTGNDLAGTSGIRITVGGEGCNLSYRFAVVEAPNEGDFKTAERGVRVYFAPNDFPNLFNVEIDHDGSPDEQGFTVKKAACG